MEWQMCAHSRVCVRARAYVCPSESACPCPIQLFLPMNVPCSHSCAWPGSPTQQKPGICRPFRNAGLGNEKQGSCPREIFLLLFFSLNWIQCFLLLTYIFFDGEFSFVQRAKEMVPAQALASITANLDQSPCPLSGLACSIPCTSLLLSRV